MRRSPSDLFSQVTAAATIITYRPRTSVRTRLQRRLNSRKLDVSLEAAMVSDYTRADPLLALTPATLDVSMDCYSPLVVGPWHPLQHAG
ncbi:MAG: hypothetical protein JO270_26780 [Acidobacteriaceae bacterium]|nr:hypothetical protein [Acidobacteriaceae bacterium]MBV8569139.1 hypothetical protein [Acidobacteriaceae bacterium]